MRCGGNAQDLGGLFDPKTTISLNKQKKVWKYR